jgi:branched-chain amino acid transport system substrate-binding protein
MKKILNYILIISIMCFGTSCNNANLPKNNIKKPSNSNINRVITKKNTVNNKDKVNIKLDQFNKENTKANNTILSTNSLGSIRSGKSLNIAVLLPLSGVSSNMGRSMLDAVQLASSEIGSSKVDLLIVDIGSTESSAKAALSSLAQSVDIVVGPVLKSQIAIVNRYSREHNIMNIALTSDESFIRMGNSVEFGMPVANQMDRLISYAIQKGAQNFYTILPNDSLGDNIGNLLLNYKSYDKLRDFLVVKYNKNDNEISDLAQVIQEFKDKIKSIPNYQENAVILLPQSGNELRKIAQNFEMLRDPELKKLKVICGSDFHDSSPYAITWVSDTWFADAKLDGRLGFEARFRAANKYDANHLASLAYDAVALILAAVETKRDGLVVFDPNKILNKSGFEGINGVFRFFKDGSEERLFSIFKISSNQVIEIDPAPGSFD